MISILETSSDTLSRPAKWILLVISSYAFSFVSIAFLPLYLRETLHCPLLIIGIFLGIYGVGTIFASFYGAKLCDTFSAYQVSITSLVFYIAGLTLIYFIHQPYWLLALILLLMGVSNSSFLPASRMLLMRYSSEAAQLRANGLRYMLYNIGCAASLSLAGFFAHDDYHVVILFTIGFTVFSLFLLLAFVKNDGPEYRTTKPEKKEKYYFWHDPFFAVIFAGLFLGMIVFAQLTSSFTLFLGTVYHFDMHALSLIFIINCVMIGVLQMFVINRIKHLSQSFIMLLAPLFMGIGFAILLFKPSIVTVVICMVLVTIGEMLFMPVSQNLVYQKAQEHLKGYYMGVYQACYEIAVIISPMIGTITLKIDGSGKILWLSILFISALPVCGYFYFRKRINGL